MKRSKKLFLLPLFFLCMPPHARGNTQNQSPLNEKLKPLAQAIEHQIDNCMTWEETKPAVSQASLISALMLTKAAIATVTKAAKVLNVAKNSEELPAPTPGANGSTTDESETVFIYAQQKAAYGAGKENPLEALITVNITTFAPLLLKLDSTLEPHEAMTVASVFAGIPLTSSTFIKCIKQLRSMDPAKIKVLEDRLRKTVAEPIETSLTAFKIVDDYVSNIALKEAQQQEQARHKQEEKAQREQAAENERKAQEERTRHGQETREQQAHAARTQALRSQIMEEQQLAWEEHLQDQERERQMQRERERKETQKLHEMLRHYRIEEEEIKRQEDIRRERHNQEVRDAESQLFRSDPFAGTAYSDTVIRQKMQTPASTPAPYSSPAIYGNREHASQITPQYHQDFGAFGHQYQPSAAGMPFEADSDHPHPETWKIVTSNVWDLAPGIGAGVGFLVGNVPGAIIGLEIGHAIELPKSAFEALNGYDGITGHKIEGLNRGLAWFDVVVGGGSVAAHKAIKVGAKLVRGLKIIETVENII